MNVRYFNIRWDTDGQQVDLPSEVVREVADDVNVELEGADLLSDEFGWCVHGFEWAQIDISTLLSWAVERSTEVELDSQSLDYPSDNPTFKDGYAEGVLDGKAAAFAEIINKLRGKA